MKKGSATKFRRKKENIKPFESRIETSLEVFFFFLINKIKLIVAFSCLVLTENSGLIILL
jgi:hypothetical protein